MPAQVYEEVWNIECQGLEPVAVQPGSRNPSFPLVPLRRTPQRTMRQLRLVVLENSYFRAEICPDLGGRLAALFDKRVDQVILARPDSIAPVQGGIRGVEWNHGLQIAVEGRLTTLGSVDVQIREPEEDEPAAAICFERVVGTPLSWHACWSLAEDEAVLRLEIQLLNRSLLPWNGDWGVRLGASDGLVVLNGNQPHSEGYLSLSPLMPTAIMPRRTSRHLLEIHSAAGISGAVVSPLLAVGTDAQTLQIASVKTLASVDFRLETADGAFASAVFLAPDHVLTAELPAPVESWTATCQGQVIASFPTPEPAKTSFSTAAEAWLKEEGVEGEVQGAIRDWLADPLQSSVPEIPLVIGAEHLHFMLRAFANARRQDFAAAMDDLDDALGFAANDPLTWWFKAVLRSRTSREDEENPEQLNAHFLAPLEPLLRIQSFLDQGAAQGREPNPLMKPIAADPEVLMDAAEILLLSGMKEQATLLLDEVLRHRPIQRAHLVLGWLALSQKTMDFEAARHAQSAAEIDLEPPFPNRPFELTAIAALHQRFPSFKFDQLLKLLPEAKISS